MVPVWYDRLYYRRARGTRNVPRHHIHLLFGPQDPVAATSSGTSCILMRTAGWIHAYVDALSCHRTQFVAPNMRSSFLANRLVAEERCRCQWMLRHGCQTEWQHLPSSFLHSIVENKVTSFSWSHWLHFFFCICCCGSKARIASGCCIYVDQERRNHSCSTTVLVGWYYIEIESTCLYYNPYITALEVQVNYFSNGISVKTITIAL